MIISRPYRFVAFLLALLMFFSSTGISMNLHYCQGHLRSISILAKTKCCSTEKKALCHKSLNDIGYDETCNIANEDKSCCQNEKLVIKSLDQDLLMVNSILTDIKYPHIQLMAIAANFVFEGIDDTGDLIVNFEQYKPPLPERDIQILFQTFLL